jgi:2-C-methyl-D-erythritol 4-phosphate cytidylyltransferase
MAPDSVSILIPAAGQGTRLGLGPKALLELGGRPLVAWLAAKALRVAAEVLVAAPPGAATQFAALCPGCRVIEGGTTRQASVAALACAARGDCLLIHDVTRPFVSAALLRAVAGAATPTGAAGAFFGPEVPVVRLRGGRMLEAFAADEVGILQSPLALRRELLLSVLARTEAQGWEAQSTMQLVLRAGVAVVAVPGEKTNIKLTTPEDWALAQLFKDLL